jgi:hypothetical protein
MAGSRGGNSSPAISLLILMALLCSISLMLFPHIRTNRQDADAMLAHSLVSIIKII